MGITRDEALHVLELPRGADPDSVRTSYKRLALKWHPDKHSNSTEATKKFQDISRAYKRLTDEEYDSEEDMEMSLNDMFDLFTQIFYFRTFGAYSNGYSHYDSSDDDDDDYDDDEDVDYIHLLSDKINTKHDLKKPKTDLSSITGRKTRLTLEEIEKNANELITEEEKEKRKAEKRKAKKKRRREKKKLEKVEQQKKEEVPKVSSSIPKQNGTSETTKKSKKDKKNKEASGSDEEDFDTSAAFFHTVVNKKKKSGAIPEPHTGKTKKEKSISGKGDDEVDELEPKVLRSRQLAIRGNEMANVGEYTAAIDLFTEAIKLDPRDFRFFGNRSYCFDRIQQYEKALRDADKAISLQPDWPKGYFRKGRALGGLKLNVEAEQAFMQVLKLDRNCDDAMQELLRVRTYQLTEMGFSKQQAESAIQQHNGSVQQALDSLLAGVVAENSLAGEVYISDEEEVPIVTHNPLPKKTGPVDVKMDPANPEGLTALWVGNVLPEVRKKTNPDVFQIWYRD